jgi:crotonobetaine/carnitine-CoA ligase
MRKVHAPHVLGALIEDRAKRNEDKIFLLFKDQNISYDEINRFSNRCANGFQRLVITKGDRSVSCFPTVRSFFISGSAWQS